MIFTDLQKKLQVEDQDKKSSTLTEYRHLIAAGVLLLCVAVFLMLNSSIWNPTKEKPGVMQENQVKILEKISCPDKELKVAVLSGEGEMTVCWYRDENLIMKSTVFANNAEPDEEMAVLPVTYLVKEEDFEHMLRCEVYDGEELIGTDSLFASRLPVIYIDTEDGKEIESKTEYISANVTIQGNETYDNQYNGLASIKGRGNTTWTMEKKPYKIKLDKEADLFGFGANKHWVLIANYLDESLMRNRIADDIAGELGLVSMESTWVDVVMNGKFLGNYVLTEQIRIDEGRIELTNWEKIAKEIAQGFYDQYHTKGFSDADRKKLEDELLTNMNWMTDGEFTYKGVAYDVADYCDMPRDSFKGILFELSAEYDEITRFITNKKLKVMVSSPEYLNSNEEMLQNMQNLWCDFELAYCSNTGYNDKGKHYTDYADLDSMVSFWLVQEIMGNSDGSSKSRYAYLSEDGKIYFGPVWDFDWSAGSVAVGNEPNGWKCSLSEDNEDNFFKEWLDDPLFCLRAVEKYWEIRDYMEEITKRGGRIDTYAEYLFESGCANEKMWRYLRGFSGVDGDVEQLRNHLSYRIKWLDEQFASVETLMESLRTSTSETPYVKDNQNIFMTAGNVIYHVENGSVSDSEYWYVNEDPNMTFRISDKKAKYLAVYVNAKLAGHYEIHDNICGISIPTEILTGKDAKDLVTLIATDAKGKIAATNYFILMKGKGVGTRVVFADDQGDILCEMLFFANTSIPNHLPSLDGYGEKYTYYSNMECTKEYEWEEEVVLQPMDIYVKYKIKYNT